MSLCYVIDSGLSTSLLLLATLIIMFYIYIYITYHLMRCYPRVLLPDYCSQGAVMQFLVYLSPEEELVIYKC